MLQGIEKVPKINFRPFYRPWTKFQKVPGICRFFFAGRAKNLFWSFIRLGNKMIRIYMPKATVGMSPNPDELLVSLRDVHSML